MIFRYNGKKYCFVHIPKSGGIYITVYILRHNYGEDIVNEDNWTSYAKFYYDDIDNNRVHMPLSVQEMSDYECFCIIRNKYDTRISAYNWIKKHDNYTKFFNEYIENGDFKIYPQDNKTRISTFGLKQVDYIKGTQRCKLFLYQNFNDCLDYIDNIFDKKIERFEKINNNKNQDTILIDDSIKKRIYDYYFDDFKLIESLILD